MHPLAMSSKCKCVLHIKGLARLSRLSAVRSISTTHLLRVSISFVPRRSQHHLYLCEFEYIYIQIFLQRILTLFFRTPLFSYFYCAQKCVSKFTQEIIIILDPLVKQCAGDYDFCENWCLCCFQLHIDAFNLAYCYISSSICIQICAAYTWRRSIYCI